jgi:hypothetical protein
MPLSVGQESMMRRERLVWGDLTALGKLGLDKQEKTMKRALIVLFVLTGAAVAGEKVELKPFKVVMSGGSGAQETGGCWLHVSDGQQLYVVVELESNLHMPSSVSRRNCNVVRVGSSVQGGVNKKGDRMLLMIPDGSKEKKKEYRIESVSDAGTTQ